MNQYHGHRYTSNTYKYNTITFLATPTTDISITQEEETYSECHWQQWWPQRVWKKLEFLEGTKSQMGRPSPLQSTLYARSRCSSNSLPVHYIANTYRGNRLITHLLPRRCSFVLTIIETFCGVKPECIYRNYVDKGRTHFCLNCPCTVGLLMPLSPQVNGVHNAEGTEILLWIE